jgi:hypothetical protein
MGYLIYKVAVQVNKKPEYMPSFHTVDHWVVVKGDDISEGIARATEIALKETRELYNEAYDVAVTKTECKGRTEEIHE